MNNTTSLVKIDQNRLTQLSTELAIRGLNALQSNESSKISRWLRFHDDVSVGTVLFGKKTTLINTPQLMLRYDALGSVSVSK